MRKVLIVVAGLVVLAFVNFVVFQREQLLDHGRIVRLELAPVDPRSLMQGDYMALAWQVARDAQPKLAATGSRSGAMVLAVDERSVGRFVRPDDGKPLAANEVRLQYRLSRNVVNLATDAWFFEEGRARAFEGARYGEFRVAPDGVALLARMLDAKLQPIGEPPGS